MSIDLANETKVVSTKTEERLRWFSDKIRKFLNSNWSFVFFITFFTLITIAQLLHDGLTGVLMDDKVLRWDLLVYAGSITTIISLIYNARVQTRFFVFMALALIFWIWASLITHLIFGALKMLILFIPSIFRFIKWSKGNKGNNQIEIKRFKVWYSLVFMIIVTLLILLFGTLTDNNFQSESLPYVDIGGLFVGVSAATIVAFGYIEGWFLTVISVIFGLMSYILLATKGFAPISISGIGSSSVFVILNLGTGLSWLSIYYSRNHTFKYVPKAKEM